uniref:Cytochrome c oxidase subunit 7A2, mitochondrial n=2 Tax=Canis lupus TaxID=9612 RepID=A0A8C0M9W6_CANLF
MRCGTSNITVSRRQFENKVPEKQKLFQEDNGIPVHLKDGVADALLYRATMMLTLWLLFPRSKIDFSSSQQAVGSVSFSSLWTSN